MKVGVLKEGEVDVVVVMGKSVVDGIDYGDGGG